MPISKSRPVTAAIVGAGHRSVQYADYGLDHPDQLKTVAVVDPNEHRRADAARKYDVPKDMQFASIEEFLARGKIADAVINGTMDALHVPTSLPLLEAGYDLLLEKPIATSREDLLRLRDSARRFDRKVMICHVLRYAPFYTAIRKRVADGEIGRLISVQTTENVSYHHMAIGYVRGKWNRQEGGSTFLMAKSCHDIDLIAWMKSGIRPRLVASFGSLMYFRPENAPPGSGERCLVDCKIEDTCPYSARKHYIEREWWGYYAWEGIESRGLTDENKLEWLRVGPFGRCVWRCDNDVVDHQTVIAEFEDGCTASHNLTSGTAFPCRAIHLIGTNGELQGVMEEGAYVIRHFDTTVQHGCSEERVELDVSGDMHGGGDLRLVEDFVRMLRGEEPSISTTNLEDSIQGHLMGFAADRSRMEGHVIEVA